MEKMGRAYLDYARDHPLEYRLMFGTPLPDASEHPEMMHRAKHAFTLLCDALSRKATLQGRRCIEDEIVLDALLVWSGLHGLASITSSSAISALGLDARLLEASHEHLFRGFSRALAGGS